MTIETETHCPPRVHLARWFGPFILMVLSIGVMSPLISAQFTDWDDPTTVARNPSFNPVSAKSVLWYWNTDHSYMEMYAPATYTMWGVLAKIAPRHPADENGVEMSAMPFHLANILLHAGNAILVLMILRRLTANEIAALAGAALFAVHPVQVEAVGWVSGGKDVLSATLALLAIWQYIRFVQQKSRWSYAIAMMVFVLAMLAKPSTVCVPVIVLVINWLVLRRRIRVILKSLWPWFVLAIPVIWQGHRAQPSTLVHSPLWLRPIVACDAIAFYLGKLVWPASLCIDYGHSPYWLMHLDHPAATWTIAIAVPVAALAMCAVFYRRASWPLATLAVFVAALLPTLGLIPFEFQLHSTPADHYLYLAMLAPAMAVAIGLSKLPPRKWIVPAAVLAAAFGWLSFRQCDAWKNTTTLMDQTLRVNPSSLAANNFLGFHYDQQRPPDLDRAGPYFLRALQDHPDVPWVHFNVANFLMHAGQLDQAIEQYRESIALDASSADSFVNYGAALATRGRDEEAMSAFEAALQINPRDARAYQNIGTIWAHRGEVHQARQFYMMALRIDPNRPVAREYLRAHPTDAP